MKKKKRPNCDLCFDESILSFGITDDAVFHSCEKHAGELSAMIYPMGDKLMAVKLPHMMRRFNNQK